MMKKLEKFANQLSESDIQEIIRIKRMGGKKVVAIRKRRDKLAADLAKLDAQLAKLTGEAPAEAAEAPKKRRGGGPGRPKGTIKVKAEAKAKKEAPAKKKTAKVAKKATRGTKKKGGRLNISAAVREIFRNAGGPLKASQVVDALPGAGIPVADVMDMRKRISVVLASQKNHFEQVERGVYRLKD